LDLLIPAAVESPSHPVTTSRTGLWRLLSQSSWQFSIRELLLLTAAVAAFLAWAGLYYQRTRPFQRTAIPDQLADFDALQVICVKLGHPVSSYSAGGGGSSDMHDSTHCYERHLSFPPSRRGELMEAYREVVRDTLAKNADHHSRAGSISDGTGLRGFEFSYSRGQTQGSVFIRCSDAKDEIDLFIFVHEYQAQP
jgi:hypothetical protein